MIDSRPPAAPRMGDHATMALVRDALHAAYKMGADGLERSFAHLDGEVHKRLLAELGAAHRGAPEPSDAQLLHVYVEGNIAESQLRDAEMSPERIRTGIAAAMRKALGAVGGIEPAPADDALRIAAQEVADECGPHITPSNGAVERLRKALARVEPAPAPEGPPDEIAKLRFALANVSTHSGHLPGAPRELLIALLKRCGDIAREALGGVSRALPEPTDPEMKR